ncbi:PREDICTED: LOW QUALITY PROTEIN [Prunus dulcis]|uniref:PREDICTED: LOW QUALITY PROTEIN n=1 Tax=Prunus dulcis TaxID=3755 RepID=A0A5E4EIE7_PRUDU|nr:PREDICTED: LOW QUALITY PROTEIN [Prunus dulcis]
MACTSLSIPTSPANSTKRTNPIFKDHVPIRRSCSDHNHLCSYTNRIRAASSTQPNNSRSIGIFPFKISSSILPNCLGSFLFGPYKPMDMVEKNMNMNMVEKSGESTGNEGEEIKRANWGRGLWNSEVSGGIYGSKNRLRMRRKTTIMERRVVV